MIKTLKRTSVKGNRLDKDTRILARFVEVYCHDHHAHTAGVDGNWPLVYDTSELTGKQMRLCPDCQKLLTHAMVKRTHCPMQPKPTCKHCTKHCYHPTYRQQIREVMKYSGRKMVLRGRLDYLWHLLF